MWKFTIANKPYAISIRKAICYLIVGLLVAAMAYTGLLVVPLNAAWSSYILAHLMNALIGSFMVRYFGELLYVGYSEFVRAYRYYIFTRVYG